jgi:hypothetical protein
MWADLAALVIPNINPGRHPVVKMCSTVRASRGHCERCWQREPLPLQVCHGCAARFAVHINNKDAARLAGCHAPITAQIFPHPCLKLYKVAGGRFRPSLHQWSLAARFYRMKSPAARAFLCDFAG